MKRICPRCHQPVVKRRKKVSPQQLIRLMSAALKSPNTPDHLKKGMLRKIEQLEMKIKFPDQDTGATQGFLDKWETMTVEERFALTFKDHGYPVWKADALAGKATDSFKEQVAIRLALAVLGGYQKMGSLAKELLEVSGVDLNDPKVQEVVGR